MADVAYPEEAIVGMLERDEAVTAIASAACIFPVAVDASVTQPYLVYRRTSIEPASMDLDNRQYNAQLTISCSALSYATVRQLAKAVKNALIGKTFVDGAIEINTIMLMGEQDGFDPPLAGRTKPLYDVELEFDYSYEEL